jgi:hypothetical protein
LSGSHWPGCFNYTLATRQAYGRRIIAQHGAGKMTVFSLTQVVQISQSGKFGVEKEPNGHLM